MIPDSVYNIFHSFSLNVLIYILAIKNERFPYREEVTWYEIDSTTHGSVAVYSSQEKYEQYKSKLEEYRKDATDEIGAQIVHEFQGLVKASI